MYSEKVMENNKKFREFCYELIKKIFKNNSEMEEYFLKEIDGITDNIINGKYEEDLEKREKLPVVFIPKKKIQEFYTSKEIIINKNGEKIPILINQISEWFKEIEITNNMVSDIYIDQDSLNKIIKKDSGTRIISRDIKEELYIWTAKIFIEKGIGGMFLVGT